MVKNGSKKKTTSKSSIDDDVRQEASKLTTVSNGAGGRFPNARGIKPTTAETSGITEVEAGKFQDEFGYNELAKDETNIVFQFLLKFWGPMPIMIWIAVGLEAGLRDWPSFAVLLAMQLVNGTLAFYEEQKAGSALAELEKELALNAHVIRDGNWVTIPARELVEGDVCSVKLGDVMPADGVLFAGSGLPLIVDQAAINGESLPATKNANDECYQGTVCKRGEANMLVCQTGCRTFLGRASSKVAEASVSDAGKHFEHMIFMITISLSITALIFIACVIAKMAVASRPAGDIVSVAVVILVASIPVAIQVVSTSTLAVGSRDMAGHQALITRLAAIEELAAMNMLCSDKTGTLTLNRLTVKQPAFIAPGSKCTEEDMLLYGALAAKLEGGMDNLDAIDRVVRQEVQNRGINMTEFNQEEFIPFDPVSKRTEGLIVNIKTGRKFRVYKGAPQVILRMAHNWEAINDEVSESVNNSAKRGFRTIGVAIKEDGQPLEMCGLIQLYDPPRRDTMSTVKKANMLGIDVKMITGDQKAIAEETLRQLDMKDVVYTPEILNGSAEAAEMVENCNGMAEVFPEHKFDIVQMLQKIPGNRVGMTGDGVNDAPALKAADVGIAVADATDAARSAADMVLLDEGLSTIVTAIRISRTIIQRLRNYITFRVTETIQLVLLFFFAIICINPMDVISDEEKAWISNKLSLDSNQNPESFEIPVIALVWITILNDGAMLTLAYDRVIPSAVPCQWHMKQLISQCIIMAAVSVIQCILLLLIGLTATDSQSWWTRTFFVTRTTYPQVLGMVYIALSWAGFLTIFACRTGKKFFFTYAPDYRLGLASIVALGMTVVWASNWVFAESSTKYYERIYGVTWRQTLFTCIWTVLWFFVQDAVKVVFLRVWGAVGGAQSHVDIKTTSDSFWRVDVDSPAKDESHAKALQHMDSAKIGRSPGSIVSLRTEQSVNRTPQSTRAEDHMTQGVLPKKFSF